MAKSVTKYVCQKCGYASVKWLGKCPECGAWDSLVEEVDAPVDRHRPSYLKTAEHVAPKTLREVDKVKVNRIQRASPNSTVSLAVALSQDPSSY